MAVDAEQAQKAHFDQIISAYEAHYDDPCSQRYRDQFFYHPMFAGLTLRGQRTLEAMCGSGQTTRYLRACHAMVTGLDISEQAIASFKRRWPDCQAICGSLLGSNLPANSFDVVVVVGGLHHIQPHVYEAVEEIHRVLKVGGYFCFAEPHAGSLPDMARRVWYRCDDLFEDNEAAVDVAKLRRDFAGRFTCLRERYVGNVGYLLIYNSLIFRIPLWLKRWYTPWLLWVERVVNHVQGRWLSCVVVAQWSKQA